MFYKVVFFDTKGTFFQQDLFKTVDEICKEMSRLIAIHREIHINIYKEEGK